MKREENMNRKYKNKTPFFGGKKKERLSKLLPKSIQSIHEDLKEMRREMYVASPKAFDFGTNSRFAHSGCEHAATHYDDQDVICATMT